MDNVAQEVWLNCSSQNMLNFSLALYVEIIIHEANYPRIYMKQEAKK